MAVYRIEYSIQRADDEAEQDFVEIGFGSSGAWDEVDSALHAASSYIQCRQWETTGDMPDPDDVDEEHGEGKETKMNIVVQNDGLDRMLGDAS